MKKLNLIGQRYGRLVVKDLVGRTNWGIAQWRCICDCGIETVVLHNHLRDETTRSCGCLKLENNSGFRHGGYHTPEYTSFHAAKKRCTNTNAKQYADYGGRGIEFCFKSFEEFYAEVGPRPEPKFDYSLERIDNNGHYEKGNVRWATKIQQARNRRCDKCEILLARIAELESKILELSRHAVEPVNTLHLKY
jgi:hypothetical protein